MGLPKVLVNMVGVIKTASICIKTKLAFMTLQFRALLSSDRVFWYLLTT